MQEARQKPLQLLSTGPERAALCKVEEVPLSTDTDQCISGICVPLVIGFVRSEDHFVEVYARREHVKRRKVLPPETP